MFEDRSFLYNKVGRDFLIWTMSLFQIGNFDVECDVSDFSCIGLTVKQPLPCTKDYC